MWDWVSRYLSRDDLWSVLGYGLVIGVSRLQTPPLALASVSLLASGMLAIYWLASDNLRTRNLARHPNIRVAVWAAIAIASGFGVPR
jgi:hypothetical protein